MKRWAEVLQVVAFYAANRAGPPAMRAVAEALGAASLKWATVLFNPLFLAPVWLWIAKANGERLRDFGLFWPRRPLIMCAAGLGVLAVLFVDNIFLRPLLKPFFVDTLGGDPAAQGQQYAHLSGDPSAYLGMLALSWVFAALGEEVFFRGLVFAKLARLFGEGRLGWGLALIGQALLFGFFHWSSGAYSVAASTVTGLVLGLGYLACGRNLVPVVIAHGLWNTFGLTLLYLGQG